MIRIGQRAWTDYVIAAGLLTGILMTMVYERVQHLRTGREIVLPIRPVDPRDLFKGDYVRLGFDISQHKLQVKGDMTKRAGISAYVTLEQVSPDTQWSIVDVATQRPATVAANQVVLAAKATHDRLTYGIERYYVPEGTGPKLENQARTGKLSAIVAVDAKGHVAIKGLILDGKKIYDEPLL